MVSPLFLAAAGGRPVMFFAQYFIFIYFIYWFMPPKWRPELVNLGVLVLREIYGAMAGGFRANPVR